MSGYSKWLLHTMFHRRLLRETASLGAADDARPVMRLTYTTCLTCGHLEPERLVRIEGDDR